jgi:uncharacterized membrane protein
MSAARFIGVVVGLVVLVAALLLTIAYGQRHSKSTMQKVLFITILFAILGLVIYIVVVMTRSYAVEVSHGDIDELLAPGYTSPLLQ